MQTFEQLPPHLAERLHSSDGETAWNDRLGRNAAASLGRFLMPAPCDTLPPHASRPAPNPRQPRPGPDPLGNRRRRTVRLPARDSPDP